MVKKVMKRYFERKKVFENIEKTKGKLKILFFMLIGLLIVGVIGFMLFEKTGIIGGLSLTLETLSFSKELSFGAQRIFELFLLIFGVFIMWWALWWFFDLFIEGTLTTFVSDIRFLNFLKKMEKHYIICGGGRVGEYIGEMMKAKNVKYLIIENDAKIAEELISRGHHVIVGDSMDEEILMQNGIKKANALIAVLPETEKNILITLTAREISPNIVIYSRAHKRGMAQKLKAAGANYVIVPEVAGAEKIIQQIFR